MNFKDVVLLSQLKPGDRFYFFSNPDVVKEIKRNDKGIVKYGNVKDQFGQRMYHDSEVVFLRSTR